MAVICGIPHMTANQKAGQHQLIWGLRLTLQEMNSSRPLVLMEICILLLTEEPELAV